MQNIIKPQKNKERAFTVLELLVVIAIIGLLSMITLMSLSSATFRSRDTKTIYQLSQIPSKLAIEYASEGSYDNTCLDEDNFSASSGLKDIQTELLSRGKTIQCYADGDNYCISSQLNSGEYYLVKNDLRFTDEEGCTSSTMGGGLGEGNEVIPPPWPDELGYIYKEGLYDEHWDKGPNFDIFLKEENYIYLSYSPPSYSPPFNPNGDSTYIMTKDKIDLSSFNSLNIDWDLGNGRTTISTDISPFQDEYYISAGIIFSWDWGNFTWNKYGFLGIPKFNYITDGNEDFMQSEMEEMFLNEIVIYNIWLE